MRYLWWAEFQKRGALHYHALIVDPPFEFERDARRFFDAHWRAADGSKLAGIQTWVQFYSADWFKRRGGDYVLKDVRKLAGKRYEQDYARMPRGWRTFRSHQLTFTAAEHQLHESKAWTVCTADPSASFAERQRAVYVYRVDQHVPARDGCLLLAPRRRGPGRGRRDAARPERSQRSGSVFVPTSSSQEASADFRIRQKLAAAVGPGLAVAGP